MHPAIEIDEYLRRRPAVSQLVLISHHGCAATHSPEEADFNGLRLTAQSSLCHTAMQHQGPVLQSNPAESIAFSNSVDQMQYQVGCRIPRCPWALRSSSRRACRLSSPPGRPAASAFRALRAVDL